MATPYYVDADADPGGDGTTPALTGAHCAWDEIADVNACMGSFVPGDSVNLNRGDEWSGAIEVTISGSVGLPFTITAYATGADPLINGANALTAWAWYAILGWYADGSEMTDDFDDNDITDWTETETGGTVSAAGGVFVCHVDRTLGTQAMATKGVTGRTEYHASFKMRLDTVPTFVAGNQMQGGGFSSKLHVGYYNDAGKIKFRVNTWDDAAAATSTTLAAAVTEDVWYNVCIYWKAATAPGANNGIAKVWIDGVIKHDVSNLDTDTLTITAAKLGSNAMSTGGQIDFSIDDFSMGTSYAGNPYYIYQKDCTNTPLVIFEDDVFLRWYPFDTDPE